MLKVREQLLISEIYAIEDKLVNLSDVWEVPENQAEIKALWDKLDSVSKQLRGSI